MNVGTDHEINTTTVNVLTNFISECVFYRTDKITFDAKYIGLKISKSGWTCQKSDFRIPASYGVILATYKYAVRRAPLKRNF